MIQVPDNREYFATTSEMVAAYKFQLKQYSRSDPESRAKAVGYVGWESQQRKLSRLAPFTCTTLSSHPLEVSTVLDVGCGIGEYMMYLTKEKRYTGVDIVPEAIARAKEECMSKSVDKFICMDIMDQSEDVPKLTPHDLVVACGTFTYLHPAQWMAMLHRMWDLTKECMAFNILKLQVAERTLINMVKDLGCKEWVILREPDLYTIYLYRPSSQEDHDAS